MLKQLTLTVEQMKEAVKSAVSFDGKLSQNLSKV